MKITLILSSNYFPRDAQKYQNTMNDESKKFPSLESLKTLTFLFDDKSFGRCTVLWPLLHPCNSPEEHSKDAAKNNILLLSINCYK